MKTTLEMPDDLFRRAKATAAMRGQTLKQLVIMALRHEIQEAAAPSGKTADQFMAELETIARANSRKWESGVDAVAAVREQRR